MNFSHSWDNSQYTKTAGLQASVANDLIKYLRIKHDESVLDIGCGIGNITMEIAAIANDGYVVGIDAASTMIDQACKNLLSKNLRNIGFQVMSVTELQLDKKFDVVFSNSTLHWAKNHVKALESIYRCLKPVGRIGLQFPLLNKSHPMVSFVHDAIHYLGFEKKYKNWCFPWFVPESADSYADLLKQTQFKNVYVREVETFYTFETEIVAFNFFNLVGLDLFLQPLSKKDGVSLKREVKKLIERCNTQNGVKLGFHRLYAQASF